MPGDVLFTTCPILHEDRAIVIVNKPSGLLSHPNPGQSPAEGTAAFLGPYDAAKRCFTTPAGPLWLIHRLDEDTSGVLLAAKTEAAANACRAAFEEDRVRKRYFALVTGGGLRKTGAWLDHLATAHGKGKARTRTVPGARPNAELHYALLGESPTLRLALLDIDLLTGKTHQIRVQAASRHHPILGDDIYGNFTLNRDLRRSLGLQRLFLHAHTLEILHPQTRKKITAKAALPNDLAEVLVKAGIPLP